MTHRTFLFVGERPSPRAAQIGATWQNGKLAAKTLHEALRASNIDPEQCQFTNLWQTSGFGPGDADEAAASIATIQNFQRHGHIVVALGTLVSRRLKAAGISHLRLIHPAARGRIRKSERYQAHVADVLHGREA